MKLALGFPALLAGLQVAGATAHADDDEDNEDHEDDEDNDRDLGQARRREQRRGNVTFSADLVPATLIDTSDFSGVADSGSGTLRVTSNGTTNASIDVRLRGATTNATYSLVFQAVAGAARTGTLGTLTTDARGNARAFFSQVLPEPGSAASNRLGTRVGVFVLNRTGAGDAFVTAA